MEPSFFKFEMSGKLKTKRVCNEYSERNDTSQGCDREFKPRQQNAIPVRFRLPFKHYDEIHVIRVTLK